MGSASINSAFVAVDVGDVPALAVMFCNEPSRQMILIAGIAVNVAHETATSLIFVRYISQLVFHDTDSANDVLIGDRVCADVLLNLVQNFFGGFCVVDDDVHGVAPFDLLCCFRNCVYVFLTFTIILILTIMSILF